MPFMASISDALPARWSSRSEGLALGMKRSKIRDIAVEILEGEIHAFGNAAGMRLSRASQRHLPRIVIRHQRADIAVKGRAGGAERHVADELLPDQLRDVFEGTGRKSGSPATVLPAFAAAR